ncbi:MAG: hypothetical protein LBH58_04340 [Tannerellaceae bacterium]|nr:hypothetical protein [Tannerellaceae bacterium]
MKIMLLVLFLMYLGCIISFSHLHIVNGITIVHAHPHAKNGDNSAADHHHTGTEIQLLHQVSTILQTDDVVSHIILAALSLFVTLVITRFVYSYYKRPDGGSCKLRAPPVVV